MWATGEIRQSGGLKIHVIFPVRIRGSPPWTDGEVLNANGRNPFNRRLKSCSVLQNLPRWCNGSHAALRALSERVGVRVPFWAPRLYEIGETGRRAVATVVESTVKVRVLHFVQQVFIWARSKMAKRVVIFIYATFQVFR